jgi:hypothetical protein
MSDIDKNYVEKYIAQATSTSNEDIRNDCLYRAGTQMEVIPCDGDNNLTPEQQQVVLDAAEKLTSNEETD